MELMHNATGLPVTIGQTVTSFRGETATVSGWQEPRHAGSTGRIYVTVDGHENAYYPGVFDCAWINPFNCCKDGKEPDWKKEFTGLEFNSCEANESADGSTSCAPCELSKAEFFTVYGREGDPETGNPMDGCALAICDVPSRAIARALALRFADAIGPDCQVWDCCMEDMIHGRPQQVERGDTEYELSDQPFTCPKCGKRTQAYAYAPNMEFCPDHGGFRTCVPDKDDCDHTSILEQPEGHWWCEHCGHTVPTPATP